MNGRKRHLVGLSDDDLMYLIAACENSQHAPLAFATGKDYARWGELAALLRTVMNVNVEEL